MKLSKLIFELLLFQRAFNFKVLNTYEIAEMAIAFWLRPANIVLNVHRYILIIWHRDLFVVGQTDSQTT